MQTIWKYHITSANARISMPRSAQILCVQVQHGIPCLWAMIHEIDSPMVERKFVTYGTGHEHETIAGRYIGTYQMSGGAFCWHVFEEAA